MKTMLLLPTRVLTKDAPSPDNVEVFDRAKHTEIAYARVALDAICVYNEDSNGNVALTTGDGRAITIEMDFKKFETKLKGMNVKLKKFDHREGADVGS